MVLSADSPLGRTLVAARHYEENDPYRAVRREDPAHSRSASDSSTRRLTTTPVPDLYNNDDDPYARNGGDDSNKRTSRAWATNDRANSYLPYSHHQRDPAAVPAPIYIDDVGSMDEQDRTISLQMDPAQSLSSSRGGATRMNTSQRMQAITEEADAEQAFKRKKRKQRWCCCCCRGKSRRWWRNVCIGSILTAVLVAVIWYFVWPRVPQLSLMEVDNIDEFNTWQNPENSTVVSFNATWIVNMTADNTENWIPTHIRNMAVRVLNRDTSKIIGHGDSGTFVLAPRIKQLVTLHLPMYYYAPSEDDPTFSDLVSACLVNAKGVSLDGSKKDTGLSIDFLVTTSIAGIAWSTTQNISTPAGFQCPN
ncbi:hypothetical protein RO3G_05470 [Lichtheimia corymbifera JMRC:FSU:9682]|uniref:Uncharacterized protein n=1 Tax=Lichtheimia corymbifera JMRC:FSU:9682 TaxID=1263082 RepID=A0A068RRK8_9FUNG|nr:hypothetical protein RO3G_05470 [Lichtheimia corymbifera JMRC:FSU:9682]